MKKIKKKKEKRKKSFINKSTGLKQFVQYHYKCIQYMNKKQVNTETKMKKNPAKLACFCHRNILLKFFM